MESRKTFLYLNGLKKLSNQLIGNEHIFMGIRPWGFHAGNMLTMVVYPYILCERLVERGKEPSFDIFISLNDWEPYNLSYIDKEKYLFNFSPESTSFQYIKDPNGCCSSIVEHYEKGITSAFDIIKEDYKSVKISFRKISELRNEPIFEQILRMCFEEREAIGKCLEDVMNVEILYEKLQWAGAICPSCNLARGKTFYNKHNIEFHCDNCQESFDGKLSDFDFWWYHLPMLVPRIIYFNPDLIIRGGDHYDHRGIDALYSLLNYFGYNEINLETLVSPKLIARDGKKMSKSLGNQVDIDFQKLLHFAREFDGDTILLKNLQ